MCSDDNDTKCSKLLRASLRGTSGPTSMFDADGKLREAKTKANLKNATKVEVSSRYAENDLYASFMDGCAVLWVVP